MKDDCGNSPIKVTSDGFSFNVKDLQKDKFYDFEYDGSKYSIRTDGNIIELYEIG